MNWLNSEIFRAQRWSYRHWFNSASSRLFKQPPSIIADHFDVKLEATGGILKDDRTTTVKQIQVGEKKLVLKRYNARSFWHQIKRALRVSRAQRCWCMSYHFQRAGLNVAEPLMMFERRFGPLRGNAYFLTQYLAGEELLTLLPTMSAHQQQRVKHAITAAFAAMRQHKITHGDMKATNLLWVNNELYFVDLDAARKHRSKLLWQHSHSKDQQRFLKNWQHHPALKNLFSM